MSVLDAVWQGDPEVARVLAAEAQRQREGLELIASENYTSRAVLQAQGSVLTNKYAEGYPGNRYYGGCEQVDIVENIARERARELFGAVYANVQPHSGTQANMAVYFTFLKPGDTVLGMDLSHGGHLTHGALVNFSGQLYRFVAYGLDPKTELIDYDQVAAVAQREKPRMITVGASAYSRAIDFARFREIADSVGAFLFADIAHPAGLIAKGLLPSPIGHAHVVTSTTHKTLRGPRGGLVLMGQDFENPFGQKAAKSGRTLMMSELLDKMVIPGVQGGPLMHVVAAKAIGFAENLQPAFADYAAAIIRNAQALADELIRRGYHVVSGGTDNHLMLVDLRSKGKNITGKAAQLALDKAGITLNKNSVPFDDKSPLITSGIRIGTPASTTRGMGISEMEQIAVWIDEVIRNINDEQVIARVHEEVRQLCARFPVPGTEGYEEPAEALADHGVTRG
ncbi:MAG TPA: serine hydroxymethyltransferase [Roseiflexaceae bacterium]|nr:serine hydroxymethyltransferase [Roseiflexaceae bacterium]